MLARLRKAQDDEGGFTLIELLVVIIIIGILAAIAIPTFLNQRKKGYDASVKSDLRAMATLEETYLTDNGSFGTATQMNAAAPVKAVSNNNSIFVYTKASGAGYCMAGVNSGSGSGYVYDSNNGGLKNTPVADLTTAQTVCTAASYVAAGSFVNASGTITVA